MFEGTGRRSSRNGPAMAKLLGSFHKKKLVNYVQFGLRDLEVTLGTNIN